MNTKNDSKLTEREQVMYDKGYEDGYKAQISLRTWIWILEIAVFLFCIYALIDLHYYICK